MSFNDLKQHREVAGQLQRSLERGRLAHAYLLVSARGSGKADVARTLAKALNCLEKDHDSCDACDSCRRIEGGHHPDVHWVRPESKSRRISVDQIRELEHALHLKASEARVKVGIIADAECLGEEASNAFLKTLEEPPAQTILILLTGEPQRLLPTILSRCLRISLGTVARTASPYRARVLPVLVEFAEQGDRSIAAVYRLHAALISLLATLKEETREAVEAEANLDRYSELEPKVRDRLEKELDARITGEYRGAREQVFEELYSWFGDVFLCVEQAAVELLEHPGELPALQRAAESMSSRQAGAQLDAIEVTREAVSRNVNEALALEVGLLKLASGPGV